MIAGPRLSPASGAVDWGLAAPFFSEAGQFAMTVQCLDGAFSAITDRSYRPPTKKYPWLTDMNTVAVFSSWMSLRALLPVPWAMVIVWLVSPAAKVSLSDVAVWSATATAVISSVA